MNSGCREAGVAVKAEAFAEVETEREMEAEVVIAPWWDHGAWLGLVTP